MLLIIAALLASWRSGPEAVLPLGFRLPGAVDAGSLVCSSFPPGTASPEQLHHTALLLAGGLLLGAALLLLKKQGRYLSWSLLGLGTAFLILLDTLAGAILAEVLFLP